ncbi:MAG TPA: emp24/gp25L/p24 family protein [Acidobacteriota bacterium]|nr:emp24/gp25L/p24 family protein [Acidobacteriota bacterium]
MLIKRHLAFSLLAVAIVLLLVPAARGVAQSFTVKAGQEETRILSLVVEDHVQIRFTVIGQTISTLDFYVTDPNGYIMKTFGAIGNVNYAFVCSQKGDYTLHFSNVASAEDKLVSLDYDVTPYIYGIPQTLFLVLVIVGICMVMVTVFILTSKHP